jgi:hypothetical protein
MLCQKNKNHLQDCMSLSKGTWVVQVLHRPIVNVCSRQLLFNLATWQKTRNKEHLISSTLARCKKFHGAIRLGQSPWINHCALAGNSLPRAWAPPGLVRPWPGHLVLIQKKKKNLIVHDGIFTMCFKYIYRPVTNNLLSKESPTQGMEEGLKVSVWNLIILMICLQP